MSDRTTDPEDVIADWFDKATVKRTRQPEPDVTEAQPWRVWYDNYEKGSAYIGPDVDTIIADDLYYEKAEAICEAHNAALAAVPAPSPAPAAEPGTCPARCGCRLWTEDADARDCGCDGPCCFDSWDDYIVDVLDRPDYYRELYNGSRATPLPEARAASPSPAVAPPDVERLRAELRANRAQGVRWEPPVDPKIQRWYAEGYDRGLRDADSILAAYAEASEQEGEL